MRQRLDLDSLLRKYQITYGSPPPLPRPKVKTEGDLPPQRFSLQAEAKLSPSANIQDNYLNAVSEYYNSESFQMSRSECQKYLLSIRGELKHEEERIGQSLETHLSEVAGSFERRHQELRKQLLNLLEHSLDISRRQFLELLQAERANILPSYQNQARTLIANAEKDIARLLGALGGSDYRKTIAEVVTRDFGKLISQIKEGNTTWERGALPEAEIDREKIKGIQLLLQSLYRRQGQPERATTSGTKLGKEMGREMGKELVKEMGLSRRSKIFESRVHPQTERERSEKLPSREMRRTFFNFQEE